MRKLVKTALIITMSLVGICVTSSIAKAQDWCWNCELAHETGCAQCIGTAVFGWADCYQPACNSCVVQGYCQVGVAPDGVLQILADLEVDLEENVIDAEFWKQEDNTPRPSLAKAPLKQGVKVARRQCDNGIIARFYEQRVVHEMRSRSVVLTI